MDDLKLFAGNENQLHNLVHTVRIFSEDIRMEFGLDKCAVLIMKRGKVERSDGIEMPDGRTIREVDNESGYKYLGILEADGIKHNKMKEIVSREYIRRVKKILGSKLNGGNTISAINSRAVSVIRYGAGIIEWTKAELHKLDQKTRKVLTMNGAHHPKADVDRLYMKREVGGRGLISVEDCIRMERKSMLDYIDQNNEELILEVKEENVLKAGKGEKTKGEIQEEHTTARNSKALHGQFEIATREIRGRKSFAWMKKGFLKKETESTIVAAQDQAISTNSIRKHVFGEDVSPQCRLCGKFEETIAHIVSECPKLAQAEYKKWRHDQVARIIHWKLCEKWGFERGETWYKHIPEKVLESDSCKILWDFAIQTDKVMEHNRPDITVVDKVNRTCLLIDPSCPFDIRIEKKEDEKERNYNALQFELKRIWKLKKVKVIPVIIGALGTVTNRLESLLKEIDIVCPIELLQKACLLGTARIIRKVLNA